MIKKLIKKTGKNIPLCAFELCFKKGEIPFLTEAHISALKPRLKPLYDRQEKNLIKQIFIYYIDLKPLEPRDSLLCSLVREYLNNPSFDNFYIIIENSNKILASCSNPKAVAKVTHYLYKNMICKISDEDFNLIIR